jgi:hypothetical protein
MATIRPARALFTLGAALLILTGCDKFNAGSGAAPKTSAADFARAALERNDQITIVAFDENENTFTVRAKDTGQLHVVRVDQIIGSVPDMKRDESKPKPVSDEAPPPGETTANASATSGENAQPADQSNADASNTNPAGHAVIRDSRTGAVLASSGAGQGEASQPGGGENSASSPAADNSGRKVLASGPGYSIKAGDPAPASSIRLASRSSDIPSPARGVAVEKRYEPMVCQGAQLMHIDGRNLEFEGDAISVEDGCEIHITNSHIIAHGVGISARAANVHIKNSVIEGDGGSVSASDGANVYTQQSTFKGLSRRLDTATFHDLGGTRWN